MIEIRITGDTPLEALALLTAFGTHCMQLGEVSSAADRILEAEQHEEKKRTVPASSPSKIPKPKQEPPVAKPTPDTPQNTQTPMTTPGPADGGTGPTSSPGNKPEPVPTVEQVRAKGIEASRKYGKEAVVAILQKFGVSGMSAIAEQDRAAFLTALEGLGERDA